MKTYDRIVAASLALFNEQGERAVTTNHIAAPPWHQPLVLVLSLCNKEDIVTRFFCNIRYLSASASPWPTAASPEVADVLGVSGYSV